MGAPVSEHEDWIETEFGAADLGDARRTQRLLTLRGQLAARPGASLLAACGSRGHLKAAYRFLATGAIDPEELWASHSAATSERAAAVPVVLAVQDTTELDWGPESATAGLGPLEWLLLTTWAVRTVDEAVERIEWYGVRFGIEVWHEVLKSGCRIEARQLESAERLQSCLPLYSVLAWRILYATLLSRTLPELPCTVLLALEEWQALYCAIHHTPTPPPTPPTLRRQAAHELAKLGWKHLRAVVSLALACYRTLIPVPSPRGRRTNDAVSQRSSAVRFFA